jgi:metal-responsive CopG/Arc/MetJ family transcriptional regulator
MPVSKKQQQCVNRYVSAKYDKITVTVKKGEREKIQSAAVAAGYESTNEYIRDAIEEKIERGTKRP